MTTSITLNSQFCYQQKNPQCQGRNYNQTPPSLHSLHHQPKVTHQPNQRERRTQSHLNIFSNGCGISHHKSRTNLDEAMRYLDSSIQNGSNLDSVFYNSLISLCISEKALQEGIQVRSHMASTGYEPSVFLVNQFINLYAKCGDIEEAEEIFNGMHQRNFVSWNAMIAGYCLNQCFQEALQLFQVMIEAGPAPDQSTYLSALRASVALGYVGHGKQIHAHVIKKEYFQFTKVGNALINMYAKLGNLEDAETVYKNIVEKDEVSWNSIITANAQNGYGNQAMIMFMEMQREGLRPSEFVFGSILGSSNITMVKELHAQILKCGYSANIFAMTALLDAYATSGRHQDAYLVFNKMSDRNIVAWNIMIAAFVENVDEALQLFLQMHEQGIPPDEYTISSLLKAMALRSTVEAGKQLHVLAIKSGLQMDALVGNTLITMYAKQGEVCDSQRAFKNISKPDLVSWNAMIQSYSQNKKCKEAVLIFQDMKYSGTEPDEFTFVGILAACTALGWPKTGRAIHSSLTKTDLVLDAFVGSALVNMYVKSGSVSDARSVFDGIEHKDLITWNSIIAGYAQHGQGDQAFELLCLMWEDNIEPDHFTFASLLSVCADTTALQQGRQIHTLILKSSLTTDVAVGNSLLTMYASVGCIKEAEQVFYTLTTAKTIITWTAMIRGYAQNGYSKKALELFERMENDGLKPNSITFIALLTACSHAGMTNQAKMYFNAMSTKYGIIPSFEHHACMVDILGRAGRLDEAEDFINRMPHESNALVWRMLLGACRTHGDLDRGKRSMEKILALEPGDSAAYVLLSNIYAAQRKWEGVIEVRKLMRENGVTKKPGKSWIEVRNTIHEFAAGNPSHPQAAEIQLKLRELLIEMKDAGYVPDTNFVLHDMDNIDWHTNSKNVII